MRHLNLGRSRIESLPESLGQLSNLEKLDLSGCGNLKGLPDSLGGLQHMRHLKLGYSGIESLPESLGQLSNLEELDL
jgi:Leucine-rich repeat (LRR) protein